MRIYQIEEEEIFTGPETQGSCSPWGRRFSATHQTGTAAAAGTRCQQGVKAARGTRAVWSWAASTAQTSGRAAARWTPSGSACCCHPAPGRLEDVRDNYYHIWGVFSSHLGTKGESYLLNMWSAGFSFSSRVKLSLVQDLCLYRVKIFLFLFLWKSNPVFIFLLAWLNTILPDSVSLDFLLRSLFILLKLSTCTDAPSLCMLLSHSDQMPGYLRTLYFLPLPLIANEKGQTWPKSRITSNLLGWFEDVEYQALRHKFTWV